MSAQSPRLLSLPCHALRLQRPPPCLHLSITRQFTRRLQDQTPTPHCTMSEISGCGRWELRWKANLWDLCLLTSSSIPISLSAQLACTGPKQECRDLKKWANKPQRKLCMGLWCVTDDAFDPSCLMSLMARLTRYSRFVPLLKSSTRTITQIQHQRC